MNTNTPPPCLADELTELESRVADQLNGQVRHFRVFACDGGILLKGRARTYHAKQMAQHIVMKASKQRIVANQMDVE